MFLLLIMSGTYLISCLSLWALVKSPLAKFFGDAPNHRKVHQSIVPRLGGLGMIVALLVVFTIRHFISPDLWPRSYNHLARAILFIALFLSGAGTLDDVRTLDFKPKFLLQFLLAGGVVLALGHHFGSVAIFGHHFELRLMGPVLTIFWIVAVMNAFNIIDGIDGLAGGVALISFAAMGFMGYASGAQHLVYTCATLAAITIGFLRFNLSKEHKVFLGDSGSQFLGAVMALLALQVQSLPKVHQSVLVPLLLVGYPLLDISVAMARRFMKRGSRSLGRRVIRMFAADNEHLHHRLVYLGLSHLQSAFLLLIVAGGLAATGILISRVGPPLRWGVLAYLAVALFLILNRLGFVGLRPWLTFPRNKALPGSIVGVIEPDEVFFHSLQSFKQDKFEFLSLPNKLTKFMGDDLIAVMLYNAAADQFETRWHMALRASEYQDCPAIVIADAQDIAKVKANHPEGFRSVHFMEKPVRVPELIRELEKFTQARAKAKPRIRERKFSLAELALRNSVRN